MAAGADGRTLPQVRRSLFLMISAAREPIMPGVHLGGALSRVYIKDGQAPVCRLEWKQFAPVERCARALPPCVRCASLASRRGAAQSIRGSRRPAFARRIGCGWQRITLRASPFPCMNISIEKTRRACLLRRASKNPLFIKLHVLRYCVPPRKRAREFDLFIPVPQMPSARSARVE